MQVWADQKACATEVWTKEREREREEAEAERLHTRELYENTMYRVLLSVVPEASGSAVFSMMEGLEDRDVESFVMLVSSLQHHMPQGQFEIARRTLEGLLAALRTFLKERETAMGDDYCSESPAFKISAMFATLFTAIESLLPTSDEQRYQALVHEASALPGWLEEAAKDQDRPRVAELAQRAQQLQLQLVQAHAQMEQACRARVTVLEAEILSLHEQSQSDRARVTVLEAEAKAEARGGGGGGAGDGGGGASAGVGAGADAAGGGGTGADIRSPEE